MPSSTRNTLVLFGALAAPAMAMADCTWTKLTFLAKSSQEPEYFFNLTAWNNDNVKDYMMGVLNTYMRMNLAFFGLSVAALLIFIAWRVLRCCCKCCCCCCSDGENATKVQFKQEIMSSKGVWIMKVIMLLVAVACIAVAISGMGKISKDVVDDAWVRVDTIVTAGTNVGDSLNGLLGGVNATIGGLKHIKKSVEDVAADNGQSPPDMHDLDVVVTSAQNTVNTFGGVASLITTSLTVKVADAKDNYKDTSVDGDKKRYQATLGLYALSILALILLIIVCVFNCPCGIAWVSLFCLIVTVLYFVLAAILTLALGGMHDVCPALEPVLLNRTEARWQPVIKYVLYNETGAGNSQVDVLAASQIMNVTDVKKQLADTQTKVVDELSVKVKEIKDPLPDDFVAAVNETTTATNRTSGAIDTLLGSVSHEALAPVYWGLKAFICCRVPDVLADMWTTLTVCGWLLLALTAGACYLLNKLDKLPEAGANHPISK